VRDSHTIVRDSHTIVRDSHTIVRDSLLARSGRGLLSERAGLDRRLRRSNTHAVTG